MSFSSDVKGELCRIVPSTQESCVAEVFGILLYCNTFSPDKIKIVTGSEDVVSFLPRLFKKTFEVDFDLIESHGQNRKNTLVITDKDKLKKILSAFDYDETSLVSHHINFAVLEEEGTRESFVRGAFLAGGSVTDPSKRYHLEFVTDHFHVERQMAAVLIDMGFEPKSISRGGNYITYFKLSTAIEDLLTKIGAPLAAMSVMSAKIDKSMTNVINRQVNCDTANVLKTVVASEEQLEAIKIIREQGAFDTLPDKIKETAILREENPELSLSDLGRISNPPQTKSCLNHRMRKLIEIAKGYSR